MKILLCNDDGINSNGLKFLAKKLCEKNEVTIVAPKKNNSACSHSLSLSKPIKVKKYKNYDFCTAYSISGTPVDAIKIAEHVFDGFNADLIVSGINKGHNLGSDILYSSTVAIAYEAAFFGKPAFCFSAFSHGESDFKLLSDYALKIIEELLPYTGKRQIWNINFPDSDVKIKGVKFANLGEYVYVDKYNKIKRDTYVLHGEVDINKKHENSDVDYVKDGYITITPIVYDKTNYIKLKEMVKLCIEL